MLDWSKHVGCTIILTGIYLKTSIADQQILDVPRSSKTHSNLGVCSNCMRWAAATILSLVVRLNSKERCFSSMRAARSPHIIFCRFKWSASCLFAWVIIHLQRRPYRWRRKACNVPNRFPMCSEIKQVHSVGNPKIKKNY